MEFDERLLDKVKKEYDSSGGELTLSKQEFQKYFGFDQDTTAKIIQKLTTTDRFKLVKELNLQTEETVEVFQIHPKYKQNYWLKSSLVANEAKILLELGTKLAQPYNKRIQHITIENRHIVILKLPNQQLKTIPEEIGDLTELTTLDLKQNQLISLPKTIGKLKKLITLDFENNQLDSLPEEIGELTLLKYLYIQYNNIQKLPVTITNLTKLKQMTFDENLSEEIKTSQLLPKKEEIKKSYVSPRKLRNHYLPSDEYVLKICVTGLHPETAQLIHGNSRGQHYTRQTTGVNVTVKRITVDDQQIKILLWDVASQPVFGRIRPMYFEDAFACIFPYEKNNRKSFEDMKKLHREFATNANVRKKAPCAVVGIITESEKITLKEGKKLAKKIKAQYYEMTIEDTKAFTTILTDIAKKYLADCI